jgi:hypothetical protein
VSASVAAFLFIAAAPCVVFNSSRPLLTPPALIGAWGRQESVFVTSREWQYFNNAPQFRQSYLAAINLIRASHARSVGIGRLGRDTWEYPLWILTRDHDLSGPRIEHFDVENASASIAVRDFEPDVIVSGSRRSGLQARLAQSPPDVR